MTTNQNIENAKALAIDAENRVPLAPTIEEREFWTRKSSEWWLVVAELEDAAEAEEASK